MKKTAFCMVCIILAALLVAVLPVNGEEQIYDDVLRLHVLASSDTAEDQAEKLAVRDAILAEYRDLFAAAGSAEEAARAAVLRLDDIRATTARVLAETGLGHRAELEVVTERFDRRSYGEKTLPAGTYRSLQIRIGDGAGQNWWCVLYPPLCTEAALGGPLDDECFTPGEEELIAGKYVIRFRLLELFEMLFPQEKEN